MEDSVAQRTPQHVQPCLIAGGEARHCSLDEAAQHDVQCAADHDLMTHHEDRPKTSNGFCQSLELFPEAKNAKIEAGSLYDRKSPKHTSSAQELSKPRSVRNFDKLAGPQDRNTADCDDLTNVILINNPVDLELKNASLNKWSQLRESLVIDIQDETPGGGHERSEVFGTSDKLILCSAEQSAVVNACSGKQEVSSEPSATPSQKQRQIDLLKALGNGLQNESGKTQEAKKEIKTDSVREEMEVNKEKSNESGDFPGVNDHSKDMAKTDHEIKINSPAEDDDNTEEKNDSKDEVLSNTANETDDLDQVEEDLTDEESKDEENEEEEEENEEEENDNSEFPARAPDIDQGWAWVVLISAFFGMTIFGTFTFSPGIFQAEILQTLEPDVQKTSWIGASHLSSLCMMGPFAGMIKNRLGSRLTLMIASVVICLGMIGASQSKNVTQLILTYGVITGIGTGMAFNPMFISVSFYFERYRGFASGVIAAGSGAGMFIGGPIIRHLIETYGLSGSFMIWGAVGLNMAVVAMVMKPSSVEQRCSGRRQEDEVVSTKILGVDSAMLASVSTLPSAGGYWGSVLGLSGFVLRDKEADSLTLRQSQILLDVPDRHDALNSCTDLAVLTPEVVETAVRSTWLARGFRSSQLSVGESLDSVSTGKRRFSPLLIRKNSKRPSLEVHREDVSPTFKQGRFRGPKAICSYLGSVDVFRILRNPGFALYILSASVWVFGESVVFTYLPTYAQDQGSGAFQSATLITALGFTSTCSRIIVGFVAGYPSVGPHLMHVGMLGVCGLFTITFPLYSSTFTGQLAFSAIYGLYSGGLASVINILIISLIGVEHIALAFGLICFGQGVTSLAGPSISGAIVAGGGSYHDVFLLAGAMLLLAGICGFPIVVFNTPQTSEEDCDVEKGETTLSVRVRMKGNNCHT